MKKYALVLLLVLFALASNRHHTPFYSQELVSVPSGSQYLPSKNYGFQINWTDDLLGISGVSNAIFEADFSGTLTNYTKVSTPSITNNTVGIYWINFTDLKAGSYVYKWYANDTSNSFNSTDQRNYVVAKNDSVSIKLILNGTEGNKSYNQYNIANFTVSLNLPSRTVYLNSTYPNWVLQTSGSSIIYNITNISILGLYGLTAYWNGDENYTSSSKTYSFDNIPPQFFNAVRNPDAYPFYSPNVTYQFNISFSDATLSNVWFESNHTATFQNYSSATNPPVQNTSGIFWINLTDLPATNFVYRWIAKDDINKFNNTTQNPYIVYKSYALTLYASATSVTYGTQTVVVCYSNTNKLTVDNFKLYRDSTLIANTSILSRDDLSTLNVGTYVYICNTTGTQNYTNQSITTTLTVSSQDTGGTLPPTVVRELKITNVSSPTINISNSGEASFNLSSTLNETLVNINVSLSNVPSSWYTIENVPSALLTGGSATIKILFNIPSDATEGVYNITITVTAKKELTNETRVVTKNLILTVTASPPMPNQQPMYFNPSVNSTVAGEHVLFSLGLSDDRGLSGFIFSTNNSGTWINDSWNLLLGKSDVAISTKTLNSQLGSTIAWKVYVNDSDDLWVTSEEFYFVTSKKTGGDYTILIVAVVIALIAIAAVIIYKLRPRKPKEEEFVYVFDKEKAT